MTVELVPLTEESAKAAEKKAGYITTLIDGDGRALGARDFDEACAHARNSAARLPGVTFGVFKLVRDFTAMPGKADAEKAS